MSAEASAAPPPEAGVGAGRLSPQAVARLRRGTDEHLVVPDLADPAAVAAWRAAVHAAWGEGTEPGEAVHRPATLAGVGCLEAGPETGPTLLYLHGGGYALGSPGVAAPITARLAARLRVVSVGYRLAPEHPWPAALDDALAVYGQLAGRQRAPVALAGDSAGGGLAVGVAMRARSAGLRPPGALVLLCPHLDHVDDVEPVPEGGSNDAGADAGLAALAAAYRAGRPATHPLISPLRASAADLAGLPATLVQTGTRDRLLGQAVRFARRARVAGVDVTLDAWDGLWHTWHYHRELPEADRALHEATTFVERALGRAAAALRTSSRR